MVKKAFNDTEKTRLVTRKIDRLNIEQLSLVNKMSKMSEEEVTKAWRRLVQRQRALRKLSFYVTKLNCLHDYQHMTCDETKGFDWICCVLCNNATYIDCPHLIVSAAASAAAFRRENLTAGLAT